MWQVPAEFVLCFRSLRHRHATRQLFSQQESYRRLLGWHPVKNVNRHTHILTGIGDKNRNVYNYTPVQNCILAEVQV
jgi:hypothetical protein